MTEQTNSSRLPIIDIIECIAEIMAAQSHIMELYTSTVNEFENNIQDDDVPNGYMEDTKIKIEELKEEYIELYKQRKRLMNKLKDENGADMDYRCLLKHSIAIRQFSKEIRDADRSNYEDEMNYIQSSERMYKTLSHFLQNEEIVKCWRCLLDSMSENNGGKSKQKNNKEERI